MHVFKSADRTYIATAGSDKSIMLWDASPLTSSSTILQPLRSIHQSKPHTRPINVLTSLVGLDGTTRLYSADSMGRVLEHVLNPATSRLEVVREITGFTTSVYDLRVGWTRVEVEGEESAGGGAGGDAFVSEVREDEEGARYKEVAELWGASGDKSAAGYRLSPLLQPPSAASTGRSSSSQPPMGTQPPLTQPHVRLAHDDFVKTVLPLSFYLASADAVVTGGSDEHLRLFPSPPSDEVHTVEAHWHEVSALSLYIRSPTAHTAASTLPPPSTAPADQAAPAEAWIVSASLDGSIRRFRLTSIPRLPAPELVRPSAGEHSPTDQAWDQYSLPPASTANNRGQDTVVGAGGGVQMTAEEEAELAELMDSDDDE